MIEIDDFILRPETRSERLQFEQVLEDIYHTELDLEPYIIGDKPINPYLEGLCDCDHHVTEAKALGSKKSKNLTRDRLIRRGAQRDLAGFAKRRKKLTTASKKAFEKLSKDVYNRLLRLMDGYVEGRVAATQAPEYDQTAILLPRQPTRMAKGKGKSRPVSFDRFKKEANSIFRDAYHRSYLLGFRSAGTETFTRQGISQLSREDERFIRSAIRQEMVYFNNFLGDMRKRRGRMPYPKRLQMYTEAFYNMYMNGRVMATPGDHVIHWVSRLDEATCLGCHWLSEKSPYTRDRLPSSPRSGYTPCLCLTNCQVDVLTDRGYTPLKDVKEGDYAYTHRQRWREVKKVHKFKATGDHRFAVVVGRAGSLFGITQDHPVWTKRGWMSARDASLAGEIILYGLRDSGRTSQQIGSVPILRDCTGMERGEGYREAESYQEGPQGPETAVHRLEMGALSPAVGRSIHGEVLGGRSDPLGISLQVGVGAAQWPHPSGIYHSPQEPEPERRSTRESGGQGISEALSRSWCGGEGQSQETEDCGSVPGVRTGLLDETKADSAGPWEVLQPRLRRWGETEARSVDLRSVRGGIPTEDVGTPENNRVRAHFLLSNLLQEVPGKGSLDDPAVLLLRKEFREKKERSGEAEKEVIEGEIILLEGLLPGVPLYDLTVEEDHSFVVSGLAIHNSNCRCKLYMRRATLKERRSIGQRQVSIDYALKQLRKIKERQLKFRPSFKPGSRGRS